MESGQVHEHGLGRQQEAVPHIRRDHFTDPSDEALACNFGLLIACSWNIREQQDNSLSDLSSPGAGWCLRWRICLLLLLPPSAGAVWPGLQKLHLKVLCCTPAYTIHTGLHGTLRPGQRTLDPARAPHSMPQCGSHSVVCFEHVVTLGSAAISCLESVQPRKVLGREVAKHVQAGPGSGLQ